MIPGVPLLPSCNRARLRRIVDRVPFWFHSIDLGHDVVTAGHKPPETLAGELDAVGLPYDLTGQSVLDIGGWDGYFAFAFAFAAERRGAARVASSTTTCGRWASHPRPAGLSAAVSRCGRLAPAVPRDRVAAARSAAGQGWLRRRVRGARRLGRGHRRRFHDDGVGGAGTWDHVLHLGVLPHIPEPLTALQQRAATTRERAIRKEPAAPSPTL
jgi:tRNA (mo5U34)-methyltransferase